MALWEKLTGTGPKKLLAIDGGGIRGVIALEVLARLQELLGKGQRDFRLAHYFDLIRLLTPDLWPALEDLFGKDGACNGCWCMYGRIGSAYRRRPREENKAAFRAIVMRGPPPGLLALDGDLAVGWCQLTPRDALPWLDRTWRLKRVDDLPVWSLSCFYVRKGYRRQGITRALIRAALTAAKRAEAPVLEAYPFDADVSPSASGTGYASTFARAGFKTVARRTAARPIMRHDLKAIA